MLRADLISLRNSMNSILRFQYFITKEMRADLGRGQCQRDIARFFMFFWPASVTPILDVTHVSYSGRGSEDHIQRRRATADALLFQNRFSRAAGTAPFCVGAARVGRA